MLEYHRGPRSVCVDLGCGPGLVTRALAPTFQRVIGVDVSSEMIGQARAMTTSSSTDANVEYRQSAAERLDWLADDSVDLVVAAEAAHWFEHGRLFVELGRVVRPGGTLAFWSYKDSVFVDYPAATRILRHYTLEPGTGLLGDHWIEPGASIARNHLRDIQPPLPDWEDVRRQEYEPGLAGPRSGQGRLLMSDRWSLGAFRDYLNAWSALHAWRQAPPVPVQAGATDVVDQLLRKMVDREDDWRQAEGGWEKFEVEIEFGTGFIMARRKDRHP